jgi:hypothetical protein
MEWMYYRKLAPAAAAPLERETLGEQGLAKRFEERMRLRKKQQFHQSPDTSELVLDAV